MAQMIALNAGQKRASGLSSRFANLKAEARHPVTGAPAPCAALFVTVMMAGRAFDIDNAS
jgi:hypothetical protein